MGYLAFAIRNKGNYARGLESEIEVNEYKAFFLKLSFKEQEKAADANTSS